MEINNYISHHGVIGQKWGIRRYQNPDGSLTPEGKRHADKLDQDWARKNEKSLKKHSLDRALHDSNTQKQIASVNAKFPKGSMYKTNGELKANYTNQINRILAESMTKEVSDIRTPSGRVVSFVAATGSHKIGDVYTAISDEGYDFSRLRNGINQEGKISYKRRRSENYLGKLDY